MTRSVRGIRLKLHHATLSYHHTDRLQAPRRTQGISARLWKVLVVEQTRQNDTGSEFGQKTNPKG